MCVRVCLCVSVRGGGAGKEPFITLYRLMLLEGMILAPLSQSFLIISLAVLRLKIKEDFRLLFKVFWLHAVRSGRRAHKA